jgi:hypothetical protein
MVDEFEHLINTYMKPKMLRILASAVLVAVSLISITSCSDDDDKGDANDCAQLSSQLSAKSTELSNALIAGDCEAIGEAYDDIIDLYADGHNCDAYKEAVEDAGYDSYQEYVEELEELRDFILADC